MASSTAVSLTTTALVFCLHITSIQCAQVTVKAFCDDNGDIFHSNGGGFILDASRQTGSWDEPITAVISVSSSTVVRVICTDTVHTGGFGAHVNYLGATYYTTNPTHAGFWTVTSASIGSTSSLTYEKRDVAYMRAADAYFIWNGQDGDTMAFDLQISRLPTPKPTPQPTPDPTSRPTDPNQSTCGDNVSGSYHGVPVTFIVTIPFEGDLTFNAASSSFVVTDIEAFTKLNMILATDIDNDESLTLFGTPAGDYKFIINGDGTQSGIFEARITCASAKPTPGTFIDGCTGSMLEHIHDCY
eukprot:3703_1